MDLKFLRNQRFAKKHNLKPAAQQKKAEERKAKIAAKTKQIYCNDSIFIKIKKK